VNQPAKANFDEQTLARVLEAAYVLQEHNRVRQLSLELQSDQLRQQEAENIPSEEPRQTVLHGESSPKDDHTRVLAQIVETQRQIQVRQLELEGAMTLVAESLTQITGASGAAVTIVEGKIACCRAGSGPSALPRGSKLPMEKALSFTCLRTGQVMGCADVDPEFLLDAEECHRRGIYSLIAVPVYHEGGLVGALELYFGKPNGFNDQDIHTCQLMAGLVTEALARDAQLRWKESLAAERASMLEAIEKLKPNLAALAQGRTDRNAEIEEVASPGTPAQTFVCRKCGHALVDEEQFCGRCGTPRINDHQPPSMQSKVASLWQMQPTTSAWAQPSNSVASIAEPPTHLDSGNVDHEDPQSQESTPSANELLDRELARLLGGEVPDFFVRHDPPEGAATALDSIPDSTVADSGTATKEVEVDELPVVEEETKDLLIPEETRTQTEESDLTAASGTLEKSKQDITWTSAAAARDFLERVAQAHRRPDKLKYLWNSRRGEIYLAAALLLMAIVIRWGIWSNHSAVASAASHRRADAGLSMFEKLLVNLGVAEPPDKAQPKGNPEAQVWVDPHTALYYCPGTDLYGKTPNGRFTSQKDAQLDQFEPAYRKACD
jgi:GAF domain-containing protein